MKCLLAFHIVEIGIIFVVIQNKGVPILDFFACNALRHSGIKLHVIY